MCTRAEISRKGPGLPSGSKSPGNGRKMPRAADLGVSPRLAALTLTYQTSVGWHRAGPKPLYPLAALRLLGSHPGTQRIHTAEN